MNRQQHHTESGRLLALAEGDDIEHDGHRDRLILASIAHALLALTATATADDVPGVPQ